ncbi:MAG: hypothetical protein H6973_17925 [Gammaproteobacteria bacterium]|nr:hypothetical protein [Gammaproteobacteria bacterium]
MKYTFSGRCAKTPTLKINQLPQAKPASSGTMLFAVQADGRIVIVEMKNKQWNTLKTAAEKGFGEQWNSQPA